MGNKTQRHRQRRKLVLFYAQKVTFWWKNENEPERATNLLASFGFFYRYSADHDVYQKFVSQPKRWSLARRALVDLRTKVPNLIEQTKKLWWLETYTEKQWTQAESIFFQRDEVENILQLAEIMIADYDSLILRDLLNAIKKQVAQWDEVMRSAKEMGWASQSVARLGHLARVNITPQMWWVSSEPVKQAYQTMMEQEQWLFELLDDATKDNNPFKEE